MLTLRHYRVYTDLQSRRYRLCRHGIPRLLCEANTYPNVSVLPVKPYVLFLMDISTSSIRGLSNNILVYVHLSSSEFRRQLTFLLCSGGA